jgi:hypothetical protein
MDEIISVTGKLPANDSRIFPLSSLKVPSVLFFTVMETAETCSLVTLFLTVPCMIVFCAHAFVQHNWTSIITADKQMDFFMLLLFKLFPGFPG